MEKDGNNKKFLSKNNQLSSRGFTLIEVLAVIAIISIIAAMSVLSWQSFSDSVALGNTAKMIETKIKLAKSYSLSALGDTNYGVRFETNKVTLFDVGTSTDITPSYDLTDGVEIYDIAMIGTGGDETCNNNGIKDNSETGIDCGGGGCPTCISNLVFNRLTGISNKGTFGIRITNRPTKTKTIVINSQGQTGTDNFEASVVSPIDNARHVHFILSSGGIDSFTTLNLKWVEKANPAVIITTKDITIASYFNSGKFDWSDTITVDLISQPIRIHSWVDIVSGKTVICIMRSATEDQRLEIYFDTSKNVGTYIKNDSTGGVDVTSNPTYVDEMIPQ